MASKYITVPSATGDAILDVVGDAADAAATAGKFVVYDASDVELGTLTMDDPAFGASSGGIKTAAAIAAAAASASGTASYFKVLDGDDTLCFSGPCGLIGSGEAAEMNTLALVSGVDFDVASLTLTFENVV